MSPSRMTLIICILLASLTYLALGSAQAGQITIYATNLDPWKVIFPANVDLQDITPGQSMINPVRTERLGAILIYPDTKPITIKFEEINTSQSDVESIHPNLTLVGRHHPQTPA